MRVTTLTLLTVLCSGLTTVAVGQRDDFDRPGPASDRSNDGFNRRPASDGGRGRWTPPARGQIDSEDSLLRDDDTRSKDLKPTTAVDCVVHTPTGEPAGLAQVDVYRGELLHIQIASDGSRTIEMPKNQNFASRGYQTRLSIPVTDEGLFETSVGSHTKLVIVHESGFAIHAVKQPTDKDEPGLQIITLQPWGQASGRITLNKKPPAGRRVSARWESFPFSPAMLNLDANERVHGPPLVSITQTVDIGENGEYSFTKLPPGRLRLTLAAPEKEGENDTDPKVAGNVQWWQSAVPKKAGGLPNPFPQDAPPENVFDFSVITVKGRIKLTDEIFERRVTVNRTANGVEAGQAELMVSFNSLVDREWEKLYAGQTLEQAVRKTVVWGRPGGKREMTEDWGGSAAVDRTGSFECVLTAGAYGVSLITSKQRSVGDEGRIVREFQILASDIANVPEQAGGGDADNVVNLGEIEVHLRDEPWNDLDERTRFDSRDSVDRDRVQNDDDDRRPFPSNNDPPSVRSDDGFGRNPHDEVLDWAPRGRLPPQRNVRPQFLDDTPRRDAGPPSPAVAPVDQAIAKLVTDLLAAGDRRTRENMRTPLKELLQQKFDAEQKAREALLTQLRKRLEEASRQVTERKQKKDQIVTQQLDRMMSLPEDRFLPMDAVKPPVDGPPLPPFDPKEFSPPVESPPGRPTFEPVYRTSDDDQLDIDDAPRPSSNRTPARDQEPKPAEDEEKMPPAAGIEPK